LWSELWTRVANLKSVHCRFGSQLRELSAEVVLVVKRVTTHAKEFECLKTMDIASKNAGKN